MRSFSEGPHKRTARCQAMTHMDGAGTNVHLQHGPPKTDTLRNFRGLAVLEPDVGVFCRRTLPDRVLFTQDIDTVLSARAVHGDIQHSTCAITSSESSTFHEKNSAEGHFERASRRPRSSTLSMYPYQMQHRLNSVHQICAQSSQVTCAR